jgi:hypothetical protein
MPRAASICPDCRCSLTPPGTRAHLLGHKDAHACSGTFAVGPIRRYTTLLGSRRLCAITFNESLPINSTALSPAWAPARPTDEFTRGQAVLRGGGGGGVTRD